MKGGKRRKIQKKLKRENADKSHYFSHIECIVKEKEIKCDEDEREMDYIWKVGFSVSFFCGRLTVCVYTQRFTWKWKWNQPWSFIFFLSTFFPSPFRRGKKRKLGRRFMDFFSAHATSRCSLIFSFFSLSVSLSSFVSLLVDEVYLLREIFFGVVIQSG